MAKRSSKKKTESRSGGVNIGGKAKIGGGVYQADKIDDRSTRTTINRSGGTDITADGGGTINITGDVVGRDKITSGMTGEQISKAFEPLLTTVRRELPSEQLAEAEQRIAELQEQAKAKTPDIGIVGKSLKWLKKNVPGVSGALNTVLSQPIIRQGIKDIAAVVLDEE